MAIDLSTLPRYDPVPANSREYVKAVVNAYEKGKLVDPVAALATTSWAFIPLATAPTYEPSTVDFFAGEFEKSGEMWWSRILVGSGGGVPLAIDEYLAWVEVSNAPEQPRRPVAILPVV